MIKEAQPIRNLAQKETRLSEVVRKAEVFVEQRTAESVLPQEAPLKEIVRIGELRKRTAIISRRVAEIRTSLSAVTQELEPHLLQMGESHLREVQKRQKQLKEMSDLLEKGYLTKSAVKIHGEAFGHMASEPERNPLLKRGLDLIEKQKQEEREKTQNNQPAIINAHQVKQESVVPLRNPTPILQPVRPIGEYRQDINKQVRKYVQQLPQGIERALLTGLIDSPDLRFATKVCEQHLDKIEEMKKRVAGYFFESLCYSFLKTRLPNSSLILHPLDAVDIYKLLFPNRREIGDFGFQIGIDGISIPDGLTLSEAENDTNMLIIRKLCEYKLNINGSMNPQNQAENQLHNIRLINGNEHNGKNVINYLHEKYPDLKKYSAISVDQDAQVLIIVPSNSQANLNNPLLQVVKIPISSITLGDFINTFMMDLTKHQ